MMLSLLLMVLCQFFMKGNASLVEKSSQQFLRKVRQNQGCTLLTAVGGDVYGVCQKWSQCKSAQTAFYSDNIAPIYCQYDRLDPIVCCTLAGAEVLETENQNKFDQIREQRKSQRKCEEEYSSHSIPTGSSSFSSELYSNITAASKYYDVAGGFPTAPGEFPHMAALGWKNKRNGNYDFLCGGTLISPNFVLTAAHCTSVRGAQPEVVRIGGDDLQDPIFNINTTIDQIYVHPDYRIRQSYNDIALLKLSTRSSLKPACLWQTPEINYTEATAIGYGQTMYAGSGSNGLMKVVLYLFPNQECSRYYKRGDTYKLPSGVIDSQMCVGDPNKAQNTCQGDSGGPLMVKIRTNDNVVVPYIFGITSFGRGCSGGPPSIYTRVSSYLDWIESIVWP